ncbi:hypothetical protein [Sciscionella marina]|uniref:hypothetical protein n=1 Tax=Sciscionella marina TaxID=508770 RepID=UPI00036F9224|nr:hypothetical protein [Sciscionella marina]
MMRVPVAGTELLASQDAELHGLVYAEWERAERSIALTTTASVLESSVGAAMGALTYVGPSTDRIEQLAKDRALRGFRTGRVVITSATPAEAAAREGSVTDISVTDISDTALGVLTGNAELPENGTAVLAMDSALGGPRATLVLGGHADHPEVPAPVLAGIARALDAATGERGIAAARAVLDNAAHLDEQLRALGRDCARSSAVPFTDLVTEDAETAARRLAEVNILAEPAGTHLRLGTAAVTRRGFGPGEMCQLAALIHTWLGGSGALFTTGAEVLRLARQFPLFSISPSPATPRSVSA